MGKKITSAIFYSQKTMECFFELLDDDLKKAITDLKIIVPLGCKFSEQNDNLLRFNPNQFETLLCAIGSS